MSLRVTISWHNPNPNTIWNRMVARLDREPTSAEVEAEFRRIAAGERDDERERV